MYFTRWLKVASVLLFLGATTSGVGLLAEKSSQDRSAAANGTYLGRTHATNADHVGQARQTHS